MIYEAALAEDMGERDEVVRLRRRDPAAAADLFQQTWLNVVRQIGRYDERRSFDTWLFAIAPPSPAGRKT